MRAGSFVRVPRELAAGTSRLFARSELWDFPDPERASSEGDFLGRLAALFGVPDADGFVLRHEPSGLVVTAYSGVSGPCYGGHAADADATRHAHHELAAVEDEWGANEVRLLATAETGEMPSLALLETRRELRRRLVELRAPRHAPILEELELLVQAAPLADYARIDASSEFAVYRVGVEGGEPFREELAPREVVAYCLTALEGADAYRATFLATRLFAAHADAYDGAASQRSAVQGAWRALLDRVEALGGQPPARSLWETLADHAEWLEIANFDLERLAALEPST